MTLRRLSVGVVSSLLLTTAFAWGETEKDDNNFQKDVIECEEALAKLDQCCGDFDSSRVLCNYYYSYSSGCGTSTTERISPAFSEPESKCIREMDCETMQKKNVCKRAQEAKPYSSRITNDSIAAGDASTRNESEKHAPVCP